MNTKGLKNLWKTVFGDSDLFIDAFFEIAFSPDRCCYKEEDGQIISSLYWLDCSWEGKQIAYIYAVATHPAHRGKGLASRLLQQAHRILKERGYAGAVLKPAKGLFPFYERLGYVTSGFVDFFEATAAEIPVPLKRLSEAEHALLRHQLLPKDGICQSNVTLEFFHRFAQVYGANGALICIDPEEKTVLEYLGDPSSVPGILAALGIAHARIRTPGKAHPFVMYFPLNCTKIPGYLGITLE